MFKGTLAVYLTNFSRQICHHAMTYSVLNFEKCAIILGIQIDCFGMFWGFFTGAQLTYLQFCITICYSYLLHIFFPFLALCLTCSNGPVHSSNCYFLPKQRTLQYLGVSHLELFKFINVLYNNKNREILSIFFVYNLITTKYQPKNYAPI